MSDTFTASNGVRIGYEVGIDGAPRLRAQSTFLDAGHEYDSTEATATEEGADALREFFRAEEDKRLGRWRWPDDGDVVVYPREGLVAVVHQREMYSVTFARDSDEPEGGPQSVGWRAARAYFDAHPETKPWHEAKPGEVWALSASPNSEIEIAARVAVVNETVSFENVGRITDKFDVTDERIRAGRRIWPEGDG